MIEHELLLMRVLTELKIKNSNINKCARKMGLGFSQLKQVINTLHIFNLIEVDDSSKPISFNLTPDGIEVREHYFKIKEIMGEKRQRLISNLVGYKDYDMLMKDIEGDLK